MHFVGPDQLHGFEERLTTDIYPSDLVGAQDWETLGEPPRPPAARAGKPMAGMVPDAGPVPWSAQLDYDEEVQFRALERLRHFARRDGAQQPLFLCVSFTQPHDPYAPAQEYWDRYEGRDIKMPSKPPEESSPTVWDRWVNAYQGVDMVDTGEDVVRRLRRAYYGMVSYIDDKLGQIVAELERLGLSDDTVVIFTSDHGDMLGEHGMFFKRTFREWSARVPLFLAGPGIAHGEKLKDPVSLIDLFPTILSLADAAHDSSLDQSSVHRRGTDLLAADSTSSPVIIDYNANGVIATTRTVVSGRWKYVYVHDREELLYDLDADPEEWTDLAASPVHQEIIDRLRAVCFEGWDPEAVQTQILQGQRRRAFVGQALATGVVHDWDFQPYFDATRQHMRRPAGETWDRSYMNQGDPLLGGG
jgi:choline-sulfatase